jgi:hypothetical protein
MRPIPEDVIKKPVFFYEREGEGGGAEACSIFNNF